MSEPIYLNFISLFGIFGICAIAHLFSEDRRLSLLPWSLISWGLGLQLFLGFLVFRFLPTQRGLELLNNLLNSLFRAAETGARYIFGSNLIPISDRVPEVNFGYIFAFRALPAIIFFSGLVALLYHLGVLQLLIRFLAKLFYPNLELSGSEVLSAIANILLGIESLILVQPALEKMTRSQLCAILACSFGTATSTSLIAYASFVEPLIPNILGHLVAASILAIPACFVLAKIVVPEREIPALLVKEEILHSPGKDIYAASSPLEAAILGTLNGVKIVVSLIAVLILILGLLSLIFQLFEGLASWRISENPLFQATGYFFTYVNLENIAAVCFYPFTLLLGISLDDTWIAALLLARRLLETGVPAYESLVNAAIVGEVSDRTVLIISYTLAGFAHLAGLGIFLGGIIALVPSRRQDMIELVGKAFLIGTLATLTVGCIAGTFDNGGTFVVINYEFPIANYSFP